MNTATTTTTLTLNEGFFARRNWFDWVFAALVAAGLLYALQRYGEYMDVYEKCILVGTIPSAIWLGWFWRPLRGLMLVVAGLSLLAIGLYQGPEGAQLARSDTVFGLKYFLSSQSAILWMSMVFFMSTVFYWIVVPVTDYLGHWYLAQLDEKATKVKRNLQMKEVGVIRAGATSPQGYFMGGSIYGYLMNIRPVAQPNTKPALPFPFNLRVLMFGWKTLFLSSAPLPVGSQGQSPAWLRGQYLGNVMGHCAECHTPRGMFGQMQKDRWLQGGTLSLFTAPGITAEALAARGWTREGMAQFLQTGFSAHGSAFDEMHEVIANSTRYLTAEDMTALSTFLLGDNPPAPQPLPAAAPPD